MKLADVDFRADLAGLNSDLGLYSRLVGKTPGETVQRQSVNLNIKIRSEFARIRPSKEDISLEALNAQKKRGSRKGDRRQQVSITSGKDLESGKVLGLKIRPSVFAEARARFGHASLLRTRRKRERSGKKLRGTRFGPKRTVRRGGKDLTISAWMISREIAVRRSGIGYLAYGFGFRRIKRGDKPRTRKVSHFNRKGRFISKYEQRETKQVSSVRIHDRVPGTKKVGQSRGVFKRGIARTRIDMKSYLITRAKQAKRSSFRNARRLVGS